MSKVAQKSNYLWLCLKWLKSQITCDYVRCLKWLKSQITCDYVRCLKWPKSQIIRDCLIDCEHGDLFPILFCQPTQETALAKISTFEK